MKKMKPDGTVDETRFDAADYAEMYKFRLANLKKILDGRKVPQGLADEIEEQGLQLEDEDGEILAVITDRFLVVTHVLYRTEDDDAESEVDSVSWEAVKTLDVAKAAVENHVFEDTRSDYENTAVVFDLHLGVECPWYEERHITWGLPPGEAASVPLTFDSPDGDEDDPIERATTGGKDGVWWAKIEGTEDWHILDRDKCPRNLTAATIWDGVSECGAAFTYEKARRVKIPPGHWPVANTKRLCPMCRKIADEAKKGRKP